MSGDFLPDHVVTARLLDEPLPEVAVGDGLLLGVFPAVLFPARPPAVAEAVHDVGAVGVHTYAAPPGDRQEPLDDRGQLHALVGGLGLAARHHPFFGAVDDEGGPAAGAGIAATGAVGVEDEVAQRARGRRWTRRQADSCQ